MERSDNLQRSCDSIQRVSSQREQQVQDLTRQLQEASRPRMMDAEGKAMRELIALRLESNQWGGLRDRLRNENADFQKEVARLKSELYENQSTISNFNEEREMASSTIQEYSSLLAACREENQTYEAQLESSGLRITELEDNIDVKEDRILTLENIEETLNSNLSVARKETNSY